MARRRDGTEKDMLKRAVDRYRTTFGADALPCMLSVTDRAVPVAVALLDYAVTARRPLRHGQIAVALGEDASPMVGCI